MLEDEWEIVVPAADTHPGSVEHVAFSCCRSDQLRQGNGEFELFPIAEQCELYFRAGTEASERIGEILSRFHGLAVDMRNFVALFHSRLLGGALRLNGLYFRAIVSVLDKYPDCSP